MRVFVRQFNRGISWISTPFRLRANIMMYEESIEGAKEDAHAIGKAEDERRRRSSSGIVEWGAESQKESEGIRQ